MLFIAASDGDGKAIAGLDGFSIVVKGRARQNALCLISDVEKDLVGRERNHHALKLALARLTLVRVAALEGVEHICKGFSRLFFNRLGNRLWRTWF